MNKLNKSGFTLVELLAVIVVLAIVMILAIPNVLGTLKDAQKGTFKIYGEKILTTAQEKYQTQNMLGDLPSKRGGGYCYTIADLGLASKYTGFVFIEMDVNNQAKEFRVTYTDGQFGATDSNYANLGTKIGNPLTGDLTCANVPV